MEMKNQANGYLLICKVNKEQWFVAHRSHVIKFNQENIYMDNSDKSTVLTTIDGLIVI